MGEAVSRIHREQDPKSVDRLGCEGFFDLSGRAVEGGRLHAEPGVQRAFVLLSPHPQKLQISEISQFFVLTVIAYFIVQGRGKQLTS